MGCVVGRDGSVWGRGTMTATQREIEAELRRLRRRLADVRRQERMLPYVASLMVLCVPAGLRWGLVGAAWPVAVTALLMGVGVYLVAGRRGACHGELLGLRRRIQGMEGEVAARVSGAREASHRATARMDAQRVLPFAGPPTPVPMQDSIVHAVGRRPGRLSRGGRDSGRGEARGAAGCPQEHSDEHTVLVRSRRGAGHARA